jgi:beta-lactamase superfamily II metal-dependent hydrolase
VRTRRAALLLASLVLSLLGGCRIVTIDSVEPALIAEGSGAEITVGGTGFDEGLVLSLVNDATSVTLAARVESAERVIATVPEAAPAGLYDVVGELGGAEGRLPDGLEISADVTRVVFVDVGQGDSTIVVAPGGETLLIDGGKAGRGDVVAAALDTYAAGRLDAVVVSHFDADHLAGVVELLAGPDGTVGNTDDIVPAVRLSPDDDGSCDSVTCGRFRGLAAQPFTAPAVGDTIPLGAVTATVLAVDGDVGDGPISGATDDNERSVVVRLDFGGRSVLITGDLTGGGDGTADLETPLADKTGPVDVLRLGHHGSRTSSTQSALSRWSPRAAVFSLGTDNTYCHPAQEVVDRVALAADTMWSTGAGIVEAVDRCGVATDWPASARAGEGDVVLDITATGQLTLQGDPL